MFKKKSPYYSLDEILKKEAHFNLIIGERSNGKTYSVLEKAIKEFAESGYKTQLAIVRRFEIAFQKGRALTFFNALITNGLVKKYTNGEYDTIRYQNSQWFFSKYDEEKKKFINHHTPFAFAFSIASSENYKMNSFPNVRTILFDEFLTRSRVASDEFQGFISICSTIIRERDDVTIFMLGNTVNSDSLYFRELGIFNIENQEQGTIDVYQFPTGLKIAVEYCKQMQTKSYNKKSNIYWSFNEENPRLKMTSGGMWEMDIYPHLYQKIEKDDIKAYFFIEYFNNLLQCECVTSENENYIFIHRKTTPLQYPDTDLIYSNKITTQSNYRLYINRPISNFEKSIQKCFYLNKVFYQDNSVGEVVKQYMDFCNHETKKFM